MNSAADECGWRQFPHRGKFVRLSVADPNYYAEADVMERVLNWQYELQIKELEDRILYGGRK